MDGSLLLFLVWNSKRQGPEGEWPRGVLRAKGVVKDYFLFRISF